MNNKGFTLIELLAVILILSALALIASTSVTKVVKDSKSDLYNSQIEMIKLAAESWGGENIYSLPDNGECKYLTIGNLKDYGFLDSSIKNPKTNKEFANDLKIKITAKETEFGTTNIVYEVNSTNIDSCKPAIPVCVLESDTDGSGTITAGDKYKCKVDQNKDAYTFYILTTPTQPNSKINLIMDQNINSDGTPAGMTGVIENEDNIYNLVAWNTSGKNADGPVTAIQFLYKATKSWTNIEPVNYTYNDKTTQGTTAENTSYISFVSTNGVSTITPLTGAAITIGSETAPLRARMPIYSSNASLTEISYKTDTNTYLYDNLDLSGSAAPYGYWSISSYNGTSYHAWLIRYDGYVSTTGVSVSDFYGIRPVITVDESLIEQ